MNIYKFPIPNSLNGEQLKQELNAESVYITDDILHIVGNFDKEQLAIAISNHKPNVVSEPSIEEKLASVGLSLDELKAALGGN